MSILPSDVTIVNYNGESGAITLAAGAFAIGVYNSGTGDGYVAGFKVKAGASYNPPTPPQGRTYGDIAIDGTGTTLEISAFY